MRNIINAKSFDEQRDFFLDAFGQLNKSKTPRFSFASLSSSTEHDSFDYSPEEWATAPRLTEYERHRINEAKEASADALGKAAAEVRTRRDRVLAKGISANFGMPIETALRLVRARHRGVLLPYIDLDFDHLGTVSVGRVLADSDGFVGETLTDPLEGPAYGRAKAMVIKADDGGLLIHSFAHGRAVYQLRHDARSAKATIAQAPADAVVDYAMAILTTTDLEDDELEDFAATVSKAANVGVRAVKARINKQRREREIGGPKGADGFEC